jgi:predicted alpha/beta hydrolase family esterase
MKQTAKGKAASDSHGTIPQIAGFRVLVVPGLHGSGATHWQSRWQRLYPAFKRVEQQHWDQPDLQVWSQRLQEVLQQSAQPTLIVAHSFGCLVTAHCATAAHEGQFNIAGALLVAPADPVKFHVVDEVQQALPFPSVVVASSNDPWMHAARAIHWAQVWGSGFVEAGALGHINAESGLGDWPTGQDWLRQLAASIAH